MIVSTLREVLELSEYFAVLPRYSCGQIDWRDFRDRRSFKLVLNVYHWTSRLFKPNSITMSSGYGMHGGN